MTTRADFTDEEWTRLERAPIVAGMAISLADPGGPIEATKEMMASLKTILEAAQSGGHGELVDSVAKDVAAKAQQHENPMGGFKPKGAMAGEQILDELRAVNQIVTDKATPEEADGFRQYLLSAAQRAAEAAKEGGFMGFRAVRVSEGEQQMLDKLGEVLSAAPG
jgi:ABC-type Fe3+ transport system substrate-binding protein